MLEYHKQLYSSFFFFYKDSYVYFLWRSMSVIINTITIDHRLLMQL